MSESKIEIGQIMGVLKGIDLPADKAELIRKAKENGADDTAIGYLADLPSETYGSVTEITAALADKY